MSLPTIPPELVKALERIVPARCPKLHESEREIWLYAGKRDLVEFLRAESERQQNNLIGSTVPST